MVNNMKKQKTIIGIYKEIFSKNRFKNEKLSGIDINKEYELIKQKKSSLSSAKRAAIIAIKENKND